MLPQDFLDRMREMLGEEYPAFLGKLSGRAPAGAANQFLKGRT